MLKKNEMYSLIYFFKGLIKKYSKFFTGFSTYCDLIKIALIFHKPRGD